MDNKTVLDRTILECYVGSFAYGTNMPTSDMDESGICIPPKEYYIGGKDFEQANNWKDENGNKIDKTIYSIDKAIRLILDNNPNMVDLIYLPDRCLKKVTPEWERFLEVRDQFISKKCRFSYCKYALNQIERINTHRAYLRSEVFEPKRADYGLPEKSLFPDTQYEIIAKLAADYVDPENKDDFYREMSSVIDNEAVTIFRKYIEPSFVPMVMGEFKKGQEEFLGMISSISGVFLKDEYLGMAKKELSYLSAYWNWKRYSAWKKGRNPARQLLEAKCGYDSKHASHAVRLSRMAVEILECKGVLVDRKPIDAEELLNIRLGNVPFDWVLEECRRLEDKAEALYLTSPLQKDSNRDLINSIKMDVIEKYSFKN